MRPKTRPIPILMILFSTIAILALVLPSYAKQASNGAAPKTVWGWCCQNGKIVRSISSQCAKNKGHFFKNKKEAESYMDAQTPGYCCLDGKVFAMNKGDCLNKKGNFFLTQKAALDTCDPLGWCLLKGMVSHIRKSACERKKGRFFSKKAEADKAARSVFAGATSSKEKRHKKAASTGITHLSLTHKKMPYLTVESIYLKGDTVRLSLKNKGEAKLTPGLYRQGTLVLKLGTKTHTWPLSRVDKTGTLNRGKALAFDTGLEVTRQAAVHVSFLHVPGEKKVVILTPRNMEKGTPHVRAANLAKTKGDKAKASLLPVERVRGHSPDRQGFVSDLIPKDVTSWLSFIFPNSMVNLATPELEISYYLSPAVEPGRITFFLLHNGRTVAQMRRYIHERVRERTVQTFYWFLNELSAEDNGTGYRIAAIASGHPEVFSQPFRISLSDQSGHVFCSIVERDTQFYQDETLHIQAWNPQRYHLTNCRLFFIPLPELRRRGIRVPIDTDPHSTSFEASLAGLEPGSYRLRLVADVVTGDEAHRIIAQNVRAESRPFVVLARSTPEPPVLEVNLPEEGYRLPLDIEVPVSWHVVSGWQDGDRVVCRLRYGATDLYNTVRWEQHGLIGMFYNRRITADAEGEYQVIVEHRRGDRGQQLLNSVTRNFVWFFESRRHCSSEHPINITNVHPVRDDSFQPGGTMHVDFCVIGSIEHHHDIAGVRVVLWRDSTREEWTVGEWYPGPTPQSFDWPIPEDMEEGRDYYLRISGIGESESVRYPYALRIERP